MTKAHLERSTRVDIRPSETLKPLPRQSGPLEPLSRSENSLLGSSSRLRKSVLPPMNTTSNGTVLNDVRAQFEAALTKITSANARHDDSFVDRFVSQFFLRIFQTIERPMDLADLNTSSTSRLGTSSLTRFGRQRDENVAEPQEIEKVQITTHAPVLVRSQPPPMSAQPPEFKAPLPVDGEPNPLSNSQNMRMASPITTPTKKTRKKKKKSTLETSENQKTMNESENLPPRPPTIPTNAPATIPKSP